MFLNHKFERLFREKIKRHGSKQEREKIVQRNMKRFEEVFKRRFSGSENFVVDLDIHDDEALIKISWYIRCSYWRDLSAYFSQARTSATGF